MTQVNRYSPKFWLSGASEIVSEGSWWTRTQRIRTEAELPFTAILTDTTAAPRYQRIASKALHLHQLGLGSTTIARRLSTTRKTVIKALAWLARSRQVE